MAGDVKGKEKERCEGEIRMGACWAVLGPIKRVARGVSIVEPRNDRSERSAGAPHTNITLVGNTYQISVKLWASPVPPPNPA